MYIQNSYKAMQQEKIKIRMEKRTYSTTKLAERDFCEKMGRKLCNDLENHLTKFDLNQFTVYTCYFQAVVKT